MHRNSSGNKDKIIQLFHLLFNKISVIAVGVASTENLLQEEELKKISHTEFKKRIRHVIKVLSKIEENAAFLNKTLEELYLRLITKDPNLSDLSE